MRRMTIRIRSTRMAERAAALSAHKRSASMRAQPAATVACAALVAAALFAAALGCASAAQAFDAGESVSKFFGGIGVGAPAAPREEAPAPGNAALGAPVAGGVPTDCPKIFVDPGAAELRAPAGADAVNVRYQISIGQIARDCSIEGGKIAIRLGVDGSVALGPAGQAGAYYGSLRVALRRLENDQVLASKTYRVGGSVSSGGARADYHITPDPLMTPDVSTRDYEILVGFSGAGETKDRGAPQRRRR